MKVRNEHYGKICPFNLMASYIEIDSTSPENVNDAHFHEDCEIYINLSGDVSFMVENSVYPVMSGSIIITRPYEYHHCVYHNNKLHKHFWILFSCAGNEHLLDLFYNRKAGENNHLMISADKTEELISLCHKMTAGNADEAEKYCRFFRLLSLLNNADVVNSVDDSYPADVLYAVNYISTNLASGITISSLAKKAHVSINTLERHFLQTVNISPSAYIRKKRLANAVRLLSKGKTVTEAAEMSGFSDYSNFISLFKKTYGMTPLKYKNTQLK